MMALICPTQTTYVCLRVGVILVVLLGPSAAISELAQVGIFSAHDLGEEFGNAVPSVASGGENGQHLDLSIDDRVEKLTDGKAKTVVPPSSLLHHLAINLIAFATVLVPGYIVRARYSARRGTIYDETGKLNPHSDRRL